MTSEENRDKQYVERLSSDPGLVATAFALVDDEYQGTDRFLLARRILDQELRAAPNSAADRVYQEAARQLAARGYRDEANALRLVAGTGTVLDAAGAEWRSRYLDRPVTPTERTSELLIAENRFRPSGPGVPGIDGARYTPAGMTVGPGDEDEVPMVIVTTDTGTREVVTGFEGVAERADWIADRTTTDPRDGTAPATGPGLASCTDGPLCRATVEERALAWLLRDGDPAGTFASRGLNWCFTASTRSEIYLAWRDTRSSGRWGTGVVREELERRMLRAPGWAAPFTGWPFGQRAMAYFDRLAATRVTDSQGRKACWALSAEDAEVVRAARETGPGQLRAGGAAWHPSHGTSPGLLQPPRPEDPAPGFGPRM